MKWYVYELSDADGVFYVGKGSGKRIKKTLCSGSKEKIQRAKDCVATIVAYFESEKESLQHEAELIGRYGIDNLTNISPGKGISRAKRNRDKFFSMWNLVYKNVLYQDENRQQCFVIAKNVAKTLSKEISLCRNAVEQEKVLVDLGVLVMLKLVRLPKPLPKVVLVPWITCSKSCVIKSARLIDEIRWRWLARHSFIQG